MHVETCERNVWEFEAWRFILVCQEWYLKCTRIVKRHSSFATVSFLLQSLLNSCSFTCNFIPFTLWKKAIVINGARSSLVGESPPSGSLATPINLALDVTQAPAEGLLPATRRTLEANLLLHLLFAPLLVPHKQYMPQTFLCQLFFVDSSIDTYFCNAMTLN